MIVDTVIWNTLESLRVMHFASICNKSPLRLLRQLGKITDQVLTEFLDTERKFKLRQALGGERWVDIYDIRRFEGLTPGQRDEAAAFFRRNAPCVAESTAGIAVVAPSHVVGPACEALGLFGAHGVAVHVGVDLDEALGWALELAYEQDTVMDADLVLGGIDAFRPVLQ